MAPDLGTRGLPHDSRKLISGHRGCRTWSCHELQDNPVEGLNHSTDEVKRDQCGSAFSFGLLHGDLGHSQFSLTMNTCAHVVPVLQQESAGLTNAILTQ